MFVNQNGIIDYVAVIKKYPWLAERNQDCVLSPDSDGLLCGLFTSHHLNWKVRGFYDGKFLLLERGFRARDCVFLDMEIFRKNIRSVGQHMVMFDINRLPPNWDNFDNCLSANNVRGYDVKHNFHQKYPLGTIHLLLGVVSNMRDIKIPTSAICPLLYTDGTFKNLFNYPDNCLSWLRFLQAEGSKSPLHKVFFNDHYSISSLMIALRDLFGELRLIADGKRGGDKIRFSNGKGELVNFAVDKGVFERDTYERAEKLLYLLAHKTGWEYKQKNWPWNNLRQTRLKKGSVRPSRGRYEHLLSQNPMSLAVTSALSIEYTLDPLGAVE